MTVHTITEAWNIADKLFPTDYIKDDSKSERAGYNIYVSTADGVNAWISDIGCALEINFDDGTTIRINIDNSDIIAEAHGQIIDEHHNTNMSSIHTALIREAGKCTHYASDILIHIDAMQWAIEENVKNEKYVKVSRLLGFRDMGVDGNSFIRERGINSIDYRAVWKWETEINGIHHRVTSRLIRIR